MSKRKIHLCKGNAKIFCCNWKEALHEIFECVLIHNVARLRSNVFTMNYIQEDQRITSLFKEIKHIYMKFRSNESYIDVNEQSLKVIKYDQVDKESEYFPPCISNVHKLLKKIHRLKHNDRFYYSLFLKNIGKLSTIFLVKLRFFVPFHWKGHSNPSSLKATTFKCS